MVFCSCQVDANPGSYQHLLIFVFVFIFFGVTDIFCDFADFTGHPVDFDIEHLGACNHFYFIKLIRSTFSNLALAARPFTCCSAIETA